MHDFDLDLLNVSRSNVNMPIESPYMTYYFMAIVTLNLSITISKILLSNAHDLDLGF